MAEVRESLNVLVIGGAESVGIATVRALLQRGHKVVATACDAAGALAIRQLGALPVYPDLSRDSEILSILRLAKADALVHAGPQVLGGAPQSGIDFDADADQLVSINHAVVSAAAKHGVKRVVSLSFGYLYEAGHGAAVEGDHDVHDGDYSAMLSAEAAVLNSGLAGYVLRAGYIYGGNSSGTTELAESIKGSRQLPDGAQAASWIHEDDLASAIVSLLEAEDEPNGIEIINASGAASASPNDFAAAVAAALGLSVAGFATGGLFAMLRQETMRDKLLGRENVINSGRLRDSFGWQPRHSGLASGMEATALVWRMKDAVDPDDFYNVYDDEAAAAIKAMESGAALPAPVAAADEPAPKQAEAPKPAPVKAAAPPPSDGPTPWNEDEAKREERRLKALERKAKRAAKQAAGG